LIDSTFTVVFSSCSSPFLFDLTLTACLLMEFVLVWVAEVEQGEGEGEQRPAV
jgi:hypothetical protein